MRHHLSAALALALSCTLLAASCAQSPESPASGEPAGEAQEPLPIVSFEPKDFPFVTIIQDDGKEEGGGWQAAKVNLSFTHWIIPHLPRRWQYPLTIQMPLRTKLHV
jgi:hypothetical protein